MLSRTSVRLRLTLAYGGLFLVTGAALLGLTYGLVRANFTVPLQVKVLSAKAQTVVVCPGVLPTQPLGARAEVSTKEAFKAYAEGVEAAAYRQLLVWSCLALAVMAMVSLWLGWLVAGRVLRPLQAVTAAGRRLSEQNLHRERIALDGPHDELKELADTFDAMLERLDAAFSSQRRFVANASHELRTPLAIVRTEVDVALASPRTSAAELRAMAERVRAATQRSERLIESLLTLTRSEREPAAREPVDLAEAAAEALFEPFRRLGRARTGSDRGAGLGLSIVRSVAAAHGGRVAARALPDGGMEVTVTMPRLRASPGTGGARRPAAICPR